MRDPIWQPASDSRLATPPSPALPIDEVIAIVLEPVRPHETHQIAHDRKEAALVTVFRELAVPQAIAMHRRLANPRGDDALASAFMRLIVDRRTRLLAFLADARRRAAVSRA